METACAAAKRRHADKHALAIVMVTNKTVTITWHMLTKKALYDSRNEALYRCKLARMRKGQAESSVPSSYPIQAHAASGSYKFCATHLGVDQKRSRKRTGQVAGLLP